MIKKIVFLLSFALCFIQTPLEAGSGAVARGNIYRNGVFQTAGAPLLKGEKWKFDTGGAVKSSPVVCGGVVYVGSESGHFFALDATTGKEKWKIAVPKGVQSSACVLDGIVYFGGQDGNAYALEADTGKVKWKTHVGKPISASPAIAYNTVFFIHEGMKAVGLKADTGELFWQGRGGATPPNNVSVTLTPEYLLYAQGNANQFFMIDLKTQAAEHFQMAGQYSRSSVAVLDGKAYVTTAGNIGAAPGFASMCCMELATKSKKWGRPIEEHLPDKDRMPLFSSPSAWEGLVFIGMDSGSFYGIHTDNGKQAWSFKTGGAVRSSSAISAKDGVIYFGSDDKHLYALDTKTGKEKWKFKTGGKVQSDPYISKGTVFVGSDDGFVYAIE